MVSGFSSRWRTLAILSLASAGWAFSFGLSVPLGSLWMQDAGAPARLVGLATSLYYLGVVGGSLILPTLMRRGCRNLVMIGLLVDVLTTVLFPWVAGLPMWFLLRLGSGVATACCLIPMETRINHNSPPEARSRDFSFYALSVAAGVGLGPVIGLRMYSHAPYLAFGLGGLTAVASAVLVWWGYPAEMAETPEETRTPVRWREHVLSLGTGWYQGFLEGVMLTFMSSYLAAVGFTEAGASSLFAALFLGVVLIQVPGAWLADWLGRFRVLLVCYGLVFVALAAIPVCKSAVGLGAWFFVVGAASAFLYPLGLALLGERLPGPELGTANAWYLACNCLGSLVGPGAIGLAIDMWGQSSMYWVALASGVIVLLAWAMLAPRQAVPKRLNPKAAAAVHAPRAA